MMKSELNLVSVSLCIACLSSDRQTNILQEGESKQMFHAFLNSFELANRVISICFECKRRLNNALKFRKQVNRAQHYLVNNMGHTIPRSLSNLSTTNIDLFYFKPSKFKKNYDDLQNSTKKSNKKRKTRHNVSSDTENDYYDDVLPVETLECETLQKGTLHSGNLQSETLQRGNLQNDILQKSANQSSILITGVDWDIKVEAVDEQLELKKELEENNERIEEVNVPEKKDDSFNDSDDEPLHNIQAIKHKSIKVKKIKKEKKGRSSGGVVEAEWVDDKIRSLNLAPGLIDVVVLTWDEVESERERASVSPRYTQLEFRCQHCVVGFNHVLKLKKHMERHAPEAGDLECEVCKVRFKTNSSLLCHKRRHRIRWRCRTCGGLYSRAGVAGDHAAREHRLPPPAHVCHVCGGTYTSLSKLRGHMRCHGEKQSCEQCGKTFANKSALRTHSFIHSDQKDFSCEECGKQFRFKKALEIHRVTHRPSELLYCAECDVNFKNSISFYQHINYSMKHIHPDKLKYACEFCSRRFSKAVRLEEHRLSIHLKLTPHKCTFDGCSFASASRPALRTHIRMIHRQRKLDRNYICHTCGKAFTTIKILQGHIRSHTGERPFSCSTCPSTFSQQAALYNHNKLVHKVPFVRRKPGASLPACPVGGEAPHTTLTT